MEKNGKEDKAAHVDRILRLAREPEETWETMPDDEQLKWAVFFMEYGKSIKKTLAEEIGETHQDVAIAGALANLWVLAYEYHRLFGPLWK